MDGLAKRLMGKIKLRARIAVALFVIPNLAIAQVSTASVVAVLSSDTGPYREALEGLRQELGSSVQTFILSDGVPTIPSATRVVLAFGSKAAMHKYPSGVVLIFAMSPGLEIDRKNTIGINMEPDPEVLLKDLRRIQPGLKKLAVFWQSNAFQDYVGALQKAAKPKGISIESVSPSSSADVPDALRAIYGKVDAIWLSPDPLLLNATTLPIFAEFSRSNHVPLLVPTGGLVNQGATAAVGSSFREFGRLAGSAAQKALSNESQNAMLYSSNVEIVIGKTAAEQVGLNIPEQTMREANKVIP